jgi:ABC-type transport system substrate-binding protein
MEMDGIGADRNDTRCIFKNAGFPDMGRVLMNHLSTGPFNATYYDDKAFDDLVMNAVNATTMADRIKYANEADEYFAKEHYILCLGGAEIQTDVFSTRVGGYAGEQWLRVIYPRVWLNE